MKIREVMEKLMREQKDVYAHTNGCMRVYTIQKRPPNKSATVGFRYTLKLSKELVEVLLKYARTHSDAQVAQIAASIKEFGWTNPILVDGEKGIIAGHGRLAAARKLGMSEIPVIELAHLTDTQKKALILADNKLALNAGWDNEMLAIELQELELEGFDLDLTGFDPDEISALTPVEGTEGLTDDDAVPETPEEPKTKLGDIYKLGNHRLMCGDSCSVSDMEKLCDGQLVDMWLTDPPYNVAYEGGTGLTIQNDDMGDEQFRQFLRDAYVTADLVMKPGAVFYIFTYQPQDVKCRPLRRKKMEHFPRTLFETEWQESSPPSYILMTPERLLYGYASCFSVWFGSCFAFYLP